MQIDALKISKSLRSRRLVDGLTHNFYNYPARFSPELTKEVIKNFSKTGDWIFDPFMGGGTSIVEALALGRHAIGADINSLAWFVTLNKTTPLTTNDELQLREWVSNIGRYKSKTIISLDISELRNLFPNSFLCFLENLIVSTNELKSIRAKKLVRSVILKIYQGILNNRDGYPSNTIIKQKITFELDKMLAGLKIFMEACKKAGYSKKEILSSRKLLHRSSIGIEEDKRIKRLLGLPRLVFTSPPYPGVHVLYNKWQIASRKETYLPYYISGMNDGKTESYYTFGGRSKSNWGNYFDSITKSFLSISKVTHYEAIIVQLVGFSDTRLQLSLYLEAMEKANYKEIFPITQEDKRLWRDVPNRKWYTTGHKRWDASKEVLLFHTLAINNY